MQRYQTAGELFRALYRANSQEISALRGKLGVSPVSPGPGYSALASLGPEDGDQPSAVLRIPDARHCKTAVSGVQE